MRNGTKTKTKRKKQEPQSAVDLANELLQPVIEGTTGYGQKKKLAEALSERTGEPVSRTTLERWINQDPTKRQQPLLGRGLLLRKVWDELNKKNETT